MDPLDRARNYIALSNTGDLVDVIGLFTEDAVYRSSQVGAYTGREAICGMMREFFTRYPDAHWRVDEVRPLDGDGAEFDFVMTADAGAIERAGRERIRFDPAGLIREVEVDVTRTG